MKYIVYMHKTPNNKIYIGQTSKKLEYRCGLNGNGYKNNKYFWNAIQKYGWDNIEHIILKQNLTKDEADYWEKYYICEYNTLDNKFGYNLAQGGQSGSHPNPHTENWNRKISNSLKITYQDTKLRNHLSLIRQGIKLSDETKEKIRQAHLGKSLTPEHKNNISKGNKGKSRCISLETRQKLREAHLGKQLSEETKLKISESIRKNGHTYKWYKSIIKANMQNSYAKGYRHTEEAKEKIRQANLGKTFSNERKQSISNSLKGVPKSKDHREKLGKIAKGRIWVNNKEKSKMIYPNELETYLAQGYFKGRLSWKE